MKQGLKYPERIINNSKACISIIVGVSATGTLLPVFFVYKALNVYQDWIEERLHKVKY